MKDAKNLIITLFIMLVGSQLLIRVMGYLSDKPSRW
jgi:hypothetical protein